MSEGRIRVATAGDRAAIHHVVNEAFGVERRIKKGGRDRLDASGQELDRLMASGVFLVLEEQDTLLASVYLEPKSERCYLGLLSILPARQGEGLARRMMDAAESYAKARGCLWMDLRVVSVRACKLVPLYRKLGYSEQGTQEFSEALAAVMVDPGHFVLMSKRISGEPDQAL